MSRELDRRAPKPAAAAPPRNLPDGACVVRMDPQSGNPSAIAWERGAPEEGRWVQRALEYLRQVAPVLGLAADQPVEFAADPHVQRTSSGAAVVHAQQRYKSVPIFGAAEAVRFSPHGAVRGCEGVAFTVADDLPVEPALGPRDAVERAAAHVADPDPDELEGSPNRVVPPALDLAGFAPRIIASFTGVPEQPAVLDAGPFGAPFLTSLLWFPIQGDLKLAWDVMVTMPGHGGGYRVVVDAHDGAVLYCRQLAMTVAARGRVRLNGGTSEPAMVAFPRPLTDYGLPIPPDLPPGFPDDWVAGDAAEGNCVVTRRGSDGRTVRGSVQDGVMTFDPTDEVDRLLVNAHCHCASAHDAFYLLGFRERDRNFQADNLGRGGSGGDAVRALVFETSVEGTARMESFHADGIVAELKLGRGEGKGSHTALDPSLVFHEYTHGVTQRLVGGRQNGDPFTSGQNLGMSEGWSDFFACALLDTDLIGVAASAEPAGMRTAPYDDAYPGHFGMLGSPPFDEAHTAGEVWAAALCAMSRRIGKALALRIAVDGLKLAPANPTFLDGRDAIVTALDDLNGTAMDADAHAKATRGVWQAFARFGIGARAAALDGPSLTGTVPDFNAEPGRPDADDRTAGGERRPDMPITSAGQVSDAITVTEAGPVRRIVVEVDISHPSRDALRVTLHAPAGATDGLELLTMSSKWEAAPSEVVLHREHASPGSADDLRRTWDTARAGTFDPERLAGPLLRCEGRGEWRLTVRDMGGGKGDGRLNRWSLALTL